MNALKGYRLDSTLNNPYLYNIIGLNLQKNTF